MLFLDFGISVETIYWRISSLILILNSGGLRLILLVNINMLLIIIQREPDNFYRNFTEICQIEI